jgi:hypothetical protein
MVFGQAPELAHNLIHRMSLSQQNPKGPPSSPDTQSAWENGLGRKLALNRHAQRCTSRSGNVKKDQGFLLGSIISAIHILPCIRGQRITHPLAACA